MTIEKEARDAVMSWKINDHTTLYPIESRGIDSKNIPHLITSVAKALQKKQDRIEEIEQKLAEYHDAYEGKKHRIYELESALTEATIILKALDFSVTWELAGEIKTAIKKFLEKKAIGGSNC